ncbi:MAG: sigma-70 family RNA polymerase sigma factor [Eubacteriales bacterium]|nr:sigma-70 family RNA polymerase sigma factor [Eubacteriales bacterium]
MADTLYAGLTYEEVVHKFYNTVASVCVLHINNYADAEDCFQNTFIKLFQNSPEFNGEEHLKAWLIRVAVNECNNCRRKNRFIIKFKENSAKNAIFFPDNDSSDISWALVKLEPKYRDVMYLRYSEQYSTNEIAEILGKNPNTVRTLLKRGKEKLKSIYGGDDV